MHLSWARFLRQYNAEGAEKGDGYTPADFVDMTPTERVRARTMMLIRALKGDAVDLSGLRYIGDASTVAALENANGGEMAGKWDFDITRLDELFALTRDEKHLAGLARYLDGRDEEAQERAAGVVAWCVLPASAEHFLVNRIVDGGHERVLMALLQAWIGLHVGRVCDVMCFQRHLPLIQEVSRIVPHHRAALLAQEGGRLKAGEI